MVVHLLTISFGFSWLYRWYLYMLNVGNQVQQVKNNRLMWLRINILKQHFRLWYKKRIYPQ